MLSKKYMMPDKNIYLLVDMSDGMYRLKNQIAIDGTAHWNFVTYDRFNEDLKNGKIQEVM